MKNPSPTILADMSAPELKRLQRSNMRAAQLVLIFISPFLAAASQDKLVPFDWELPALLLK